METKYISVPFTVFTSSVLPVVAIPLDTISVSVEREHIFMVKGLYNISH